MSDEKKKTRIVRVTLPGGAVMEVPGRVVSSYGGLVVGENYGLVRGWAQNAWVSFEEIER